MDDKVVADKRFDNKCGEGSICCQQVYLIPESAGEKSFGPYGAWKTWVNRNGECNTPQSEAEKWKLEAFQKMAEQNHENCIRLDYNCGACLIREMCTSNFKASED